jgi:hypothetical protein
MTYRKLRAGPLVPPCISWNRTATVVGAEVHDSDADHAVHGAAPRLSRAIATMDTKPVTAWRQRATLKKATTFGDAEVAGCEAILVAAASATALCQSLLRYH